MDHGPGGALSPAPPRGFGGALDWLGGVTWEAAQLTEVPSSDWAEAEGAGPAAGLCGPGPGSPLRRHVPLAGPGRGPPPPRR